MTHQLDKVDYTQQTGKLLDPKTARSDKSVAYVTNNKRLYSTFCTVKANYLYIIYIIFVLKFTEPEAEVKIQ